MMNPMTAWQSRPKIYERGGQLWPTFVHSCQAEITHHGVLGTHVVNNEGADDGSRHVEQAECTDKHRCDVKTGIETYLMTTFQPKTTVRDSFPPVMLEREMIRR